MGDTVTLFVDRCVMCSRCVRFCREVSGTGELMVINRGAHEEIDVFPGYPLENKLSGNVVDLCPVGALGDADFLYKQRVWFMEKREQVCAGCSTGCSIYVDENQDQIYRLKPRENMHVNQWWMCDDGRYGWKHAHSDHRLTFTQSRGANGEHVNVEWSPLLEEIEGKLKQAKRIAAVISPMLTVEEAFLLCTLVREHDPEATLALGHVPVIGEDETFKNGFTIHAEKCPNRRGVEEVIAGFGGNTTGWQELQSQIAADDFDLVWVTGGYPQDWADDDVAAAFDGEATVIVQDIFDSPLWQRADYRLPAAVFAEREGSFVNHADRLQSVSWAIRPPAGVQVEGWVYWRLLGREGLYKGRKVLDDLSRETSYFAAAMQEVPAVGVDLRVNLLADA
jgi:NADH-quinone oxidoreductase subunit G